MRKLLTILTIFLAPSLALAGGGPRQNFAHYGRVLNAVNLGADSNSFTVDLSQPEQQGVYGLAVVWIALTDANNSTTALTMSCTGSRDGGTTDYALQDCTTASGVCTSNDASWSKNPSAMTSKNWLWRVDIEGVPELECTLTDTGGTASDLVTAYITFATKG